jgi:serine protease Do
MRGLPRIVAQTPIGKTVDVEVLRQNQTKILQVSVGQLDEPEDKIDLDGGKPKEDKPETSSILGLTLVPLTDDMRAKAGLDPKVKGLLVMEVDPDSPAAQKSLKPGDIIVEAQQEPIATTADIERSIDKVKQAGGKSVLLLVEDGKGETRFVAVPF